MKLDATHTYDFEDELYNTGYVPVSRDGDTIVLKCKKSGLKTEMMPTLVATIVPSDKNSEDLWFDVSLIDFPDLQSKDIDYYDDYAYWIDKWGYAAGAAETLSRAVVHLDSYYED